MGHQKEAALLGSVGRSMLNRVSRASKHKSDRVVDKRRRILSKKEIAQIIKEMD